MRLTNRQQEIIIDEIYNQVSKPIIEANNKALESSAIDDDYTKDYQKYQKLYKKYTALSKEMDELKDVYKYKFFNGHKFSYDVFTEESKRNYFSSKLDLVKIPSKQAIEKELILAGNKDIPELIETIVAKLKK